MSTTQYTVRNVPKALDARLRSISARQKRSLNKVILDQLSSSLKDHTELTAPKKINHDFDKFIGVWSAEEADEFNKIVEEGRQVDPKDWQ